MEQALANAYASKIGRAFSGNKLFRELFVTDNLLPAKITYLIIT